METDVIPIKNKREMWVVGYVRGSLEYNTKEYTKN